MRPVVLLGEEQPALRRRYRDFLRAHGCEVLEAEDTAQLVRLARECAPTHVVLDPDLGEGQGHDAVLALLDLGLRSEIIFNTSRPCHLEDDFSSWIADAYVVRSSDVAGWGEALLPHLKSQALQAQALGGAQ